MPIAQPLIALPRALPLPPPPVPSFLTTSPWTSRPASSTSRVSPTKPSSHQVSAAQRGCRFQSRPCYCCCQHCDLRFGLQYLRLHCVLSLRLPLCCRPAPQPPRV